VKLPAGVQNQRLDQAVTALLRSRGIDVSAREVRAAIKDGRITVDGRRRSPASTPPEGGQLELAGFVPRAEARVHPEPALLERVSILHEDDTLLFLSKPAGMPVAPLSSGERGSLLAAAIAHAPSIASAGPPLEGGLGHRLDVETSGVVVFGKDEAARARVRAAFRACEVEKLYRCLVRDPGGRWALEAVLDAPLSGRGARVRALQAGEGGLAAETRIRPRSAQRGGLRWLEARPRTGRRHQIRVHLASVGTPIVSDPVYGEPHPEVPRLALHALGLSLLGRPMIVAPLPADLRQPLLHLGFEEDEISP
jgi:23S rRNA pseudouridine1911/1915/1917 synthase